VLLIRPADLLVARIPVHTPSSLRSASLTPAARGPGLGAGRARTWPAASGPYLTGRDSTSECDKAPPPASDVTFPRRAPSFASDAPQPSGAVPSNEEDKMSRIPSHTIEDAPPASRPLLEDMLQFSPTGRLLNLHAQMAHSPAVLTAYVSIRRATSGHGTLDQPVRTALMLAAAVADDSEYALAIISMLALRSGWRPDQVHALRAGQALGEDKTDALIGVVREAAANSGRVGDATWTRAADHGWSDEELAEAFGYLGLTVFTSYFLNYAATELDIPAALPVTEGA
jgi:alkylhydroperoxidase family enzyme